MYKNKLFMTYSFLLHHVNITIRSHRNVSKNHDIDKLQLILFIVDKHQTKIPKKHHVLDVDCHPVLIDYIGTHVPHLSTNLPTVHLCEVSVLKA